MPIHSLRTVLCLATALVAVPSFAQERPAPPAPAANAPLEEQFRDPPNSARPRVWWHWMNGNISKDGIAKDIAWMKRVGIGGLQNFDANLQTPQVVDHRLVYMTPEWKDAFRFAAQEADRQGLELAIASSPGWSETGGPWVKPEDGLKKLVWSETQVTGGKAFTGKLAPPPGATGPYQDLPMAKSIEEMISGAKGAEPPQHYQDVAVLAVPLAPIAMVRPRASLGDGSAIDGGALSDQDLNTGVDVPHGTPDKPNAVLLTYDKPQTIRSASIFLPGARMMFGGPSVAPVLEASDDGKTWRKVADFHVEQVPTTIAFAPVTARQFRVVLTPLSPTMSNMGSAAPGLAMDLGAMMGAVGALPFRVADFRLSGEAAIDQSQLKAGYAIPHDYYALGNPGDGAKGPDVGKVIDLTGKLRADGTLDWTPPAGNWRVIRMGYSLLGTTNHPAPPEATGLEVDKFDGDAVRRYLDHYLGMYKDAAGPGMVGQRGVRALLTDSIEVGAANWTPKMVEQFKRLRGYDPTPWLPAITGTLIGSREDSDRFLYDYRRTLADLMASEHYGTVAKVAHENGLKVYGEALEDHRPSLGDDMTMRSHTDVPMAAMWTHSREQGPNPSYLADIKGAASVAHLYGQNLVAAESMTAALNPWNFAPKDLKRIIDLEFVTGVNRPVVHTSVHVPVDDKKPGLSLFIFGQYFNRMESWGEMAKPWVDYIARSSLLLQDGRNVADVAYFYGEEAPLTGLYGDKPVADAPVTHAYDFLSHDALTDLLTNDGNEVVAPSGARYRAIYLGGSSQHMTLGALTKLAALVEGGATVIGEAPVSTPSLMAEGKSGEWSALVAKLWPGSGDATVGKGRVIAGKDVEGALRTLGVAPDFAFTGADAGVKIPFVHRRDAQGEIYYLSNPQASPQTIDAHFRVTGKAPELWHAETGTSEPVSYRIENGETVVPLSLVADDAVFVVFRKPATAQSLTVPAKTVQKLSSLDDGWTVRFQADRGAPTSVAMAKLSPLNESSDPGVKYFSGEATYSRSFALPKGAKPGQPLWLDLGQVGDLAEVRVNGQPVGAAWHAPYRIDIGKAVKSGSNTIEVKVANLWVNRLIGDAQPGAQKITWTALPTYKADAPLRPSGLIGPVVLEGGK
ncbi:alpha-L-rhamnosidase-like protein [Novosphingobium sp. PhB165]|uniref:glycosyl hydrolase n=1 Tax=Novosphingobium sp. PhB165 TaxID=2485105 RepID=UPI00104BEA72|nr:glycosyl hydrolase [Novosphingobium sp. PhB165]TCM19723.1 alpha-L-rhamnosidase-like protein [Novosphingobium sp. PhB165]